MNRVGLLITGLILSLGTHSLLACCAVSKPGTAVVNADQTVLIIWNPATKTQHFVRKANFKSDVDKIGFLVPSPAKPTLAEATPRVFQSLHDFTKPEVIRVPKKAGFGGGQGGGFGGAGGVQIIEQKRVAGYDTTILTADNADALADWLKENEFDYSQAVKEWAKPYIDQKWYFTALKVATTEKLKQAALSTLQTTSLRITFQTDTPLFPYREPKSENLQKLNAKNRELRLFFISDQRYQAEYGPQKKRWSGTVVWANKLSEQQRRIVLGQLKLKPQDELQRMWLTEFSDQWQYNIAQHDVTFAPDAKQESVARPPVTEFAR